MFVLKNLSICVIALCIGAQHICAQEIPEHFDQFLESHCFECHDDSVQKGELNLLDLEFKLSDPYHLDQWVQVFDRIKSGEMPPKKKPRPDAENQAKTLRILRQSLTKADKQRQLTDGRVNVRRLSRREYQHSIESILGIALPLEDYLPEDSIAHIFDTEAKAQQLSHFHLEQYLNAADAAIDHAFDRALKKPSSFDKHYDSNQLTYDGPGNYRGAENKNGQAIFWPYRSLQFYGRINTTKAPESGWYDITLKGVKSINREVVWGIFQSGFCSSAAPTMYSIGVVEATKQKRDITYRCYLQKNHILRLKPADATLPRATNRPKGGNLIYGKHKMLESKIPAIAIQGVRLKRVYPKGDRAAITTALFGEQSPYQLAKLPIKEKTSYLDRRIWSFANRAFRRPVSREQIEPYLKLVKNDYKQKKDIQNSLKLGYRAILCSPRFLTFHEQSGQLDQHALANRLSYMLWNQPPDYTLRQLADKGQLNQAEIRKNAERMLNDKRSRRFVKNFIAHWLDLKEIDATAPDQKYVAYDPIVHHSIVLETNLFFNRLIKENLSVSHFIQSNFSVLNERLVRFYGIKNSNIKLGEGFQKVNLRGNPRGGLITHSSVLKVTADGTSTSPIVRGVYVNERILGRKIPPPPSGIPAVEPDIRGAISIRDQIEKHRENESCAACHRKLDPAGFALEMFSPIGLWRSQYGVRKTSAKVDPSGITPDGKVFKDINGWKRIYSQRPKMLAANLAEHLITYSSGATPSFYDRQAIKSIVDASAADNYGVRSVIINTILSEPFRTK